MNTRFANTPKVTLDWNPRNLLESPAHMIQYALREFGPEQQTYLDGHAKISEIASSTTLTNDEMFAALEAVRTPSFEEAHRIACWAAQTMVLARKQLIERVGEVRTAEFIGEQAARFHVRALPTHFGNTGL